MAELIKTKGLKKIYGKVSPTVALDDVNLNIEEGEFLSLLGQSGSGKSTLLNLLGLLDTPSAGSIIIDGREVSSLNKKEAALVRNKLIGFIFQFHHLLPEFSVCENITMPARIAGIMDKSCLDFSEDIIELLGLKKLKNKKANQLSGGEKQRVAIGRAIINRPKLILADEPTGNLDSVNTNNVYELFRNINSNYGTAFFIVTHDNSISRKMNRVITISDGKLIVPRGRQTV